MATVVDMGVSCGACPGPCEEDGACIELDHLSAGAGFACGARGKQGRVWCWGGNTQGRLGVEGDGVFSSPIEATLDEGIRSAGIDAIGSGGRHTCVKKRGVDLNASVWCWGANDREQFGSKDSPDPSHVPYPVGLTFEDGVSASQGRLSVGRDHACVHWLNATEERPNMLCWGDDQASQLASIGDAPSGCDAGQKCIEPQSARFAINPGQFIRAAAAGGDATCAVHTFAGSDELYFSCAGELGEPSGNGSYQLRLYPEDPKAFPLQGSALALTPCHLEVGAEGACAIMSAGACADPPVGEVRCFGASNLAPLGRPDVSDRTEPLAVLDEDGEALEGIFDVSIADRHACATNGQRVWCWGESKGYRLGVPPGASSSSAVEVPFEEPPGVIKDVVVGDTFSCALAENGLWCWGEGASGQLGRGPVEDGESGLGPARVTF